MPKWSIEHILPQKPGKSTNWVSMISPNNPDAFKTIHDAYVHKIGNLTLTAYNPELSNHDFTEKMNYTDEGIYTGLRSELCINQSIAGPGESMSNKSTWTTSDIDRRTEWFTKQLLTMYPVNPNFYHSR